MKHVQDGTPLADLFVAERAAEPELGAMERDWSRFSEALSSGAAPLPIGQVTLSAASPVIGKLGSGLAVGLLIGAGAAAGVQALTTQTAALPSPAPIAKAMGAAPVAPRESAAPPPAAEAPSAQAVAGDEPKPIASAPLLGPGSARRGPDFDAELRLIELAKQQIDAGRPHLARIWLAEHQQRYPAGVFTVERRALLTLAACAEQSPDAPRAAADFARAYPTSPFIDRIRSACEPRRSRNDSEVEMNLPPRVDE